MSHNEPTQSLTTPIPTPVAPGPVATGPYAPAIVAGVIFIAVAILGVLVEAGRIPLNWTDSALLWSGVLGLLAVVAGIVGLVNQRR